MIINSDLVDQVFTIVVDYSRSFKDSINAGRYNYVNRDIIEKYFPLANNECGRMERIFKLYHFNKEVDSDDAIRQMNEDGCLPATPQELLAFGEANPELQRQFQIIALGYAQVGRYGSYNVVSLSSFFNKRGLFLRLRDDIWNDYCLFLGVGK